MATVKAPKAPIKKAWLRKKEAAQRLSVSESWIYRMGVEGVLTAHRPHGRGCGKPVFYMADEIELFAETGDMEAVKNFRKKKKRI